MPLPEQNELSWKVCIAITSIVALSLTSIRIWDRARKRKWWWDDTIAVFLLVLGTFNLVYVLVREEYLKTITQNDKGFFWSSWFGMAQYYCIIWMSRMALALSVARLFPSSGRPRKYAYGLLITCLLFCIACIVIGPATCPSKTAPWHQLRFEDCFTVGRAKTLVVTLCTMSMDVAADVALTVYPIVVVWRLKLPAGKRRLVIGLFTASILSLITAIFFGVACFINKALGEDETFLFSMFSLLQAAISIAVCNLVIVTFIIYRFINGCGQFREQVSLLRSRGLGRGGAGEDGVDLEQSGSAATPMTFTSIYTGSEAPNLSREDSDICSTGLDWEPSASSSGDPLQKEVPAPNGEV